MIYLQYVNDNLQYTNVIDHRGYRGYTVDLSQSVIYCRVALEDTLFNEYTQSVGNNYWTADCLKT